MILYACLLFPLSSILLAAAIAISIAADRRLREPAGSLCPGCGYVLAGVPHSGLCPECGVSEAARDELLSLQVNWTPGLAASPVVVCLACWAGALVVLSLHVGPGDPLVPVVGAVCWPPLVVALILACLLWRRPASKVISTAGACLAITAVYIALFSRLSAPAQPGDRIAALVVPLLGFIALGPGMLLGTLIAFPWRRPHPTTGEAGPRPSRPHP